nr:hypothetical protein CFP56_72344 [Quercus suber]
MRAVEHLGFGGCLRDCWSPKASATDSIPSPQVSTGYANKRIWIEPEATPWDSGRDRQEVESELALCRA